MTTAQDLKTIDDMVDHSQKWHEGGNSRSIARSTEGITLITNKIESLGHAIKKLKENVHAIRF
jgi:hypothetical protein